MPSSPHSTAHSAESGEVFYPRCRHVHRSRGAFRNSSRVDAYAGQDHSRGNPHPQGIQATGCHVPAEPGLAVNGEDPRDLGTFLQQEGSSASAEQLLAEVKGIYSGLVAVTAKCIKRDAQLADHNALCRWISTNTGSWQALIEGCRALLIEHHDLLMTSKHLRAGLALRSFAMPYSMPARMWKSGIHGYLEVSRHRRLEFAAYMLAFIYLAYQMMVLLSDTVLGLTSMWIECLRDLACFQTIIEEDTPMRAQCGVAARCYSLASDRHPVAGRLYHHLGIVEWPILRKLSCYAKSQTCIVPLQGAQDSLDAFYSPSAISKKLPGSILFSLEGHNVIFYAILDKRNGEPVSVDMHGTDTSQLLGFSSWKLGAIEPDLAEARLVPQRKDGFSNGLPTLLRCSAFIHGRHGRANYNANFSSRVPESKEAGICESCAIQRLRAKQISWPRTLTHFRGVLRGATSFLRNSILLKGIIFLRITKCVPGAFALPIERRPSSVVSDLIADTHALIMPALPYSIALIGLIRLAWVGICLRNRSSTSNHEQEPWLTPWLSAISAFFFMLFIRWEEYRSDEQITAFTAWAASCVNLFVSYSRCLAPVTAFSLWTFVGAAVVGLSPTLLTGGRAAALEQAGPLVITGWIYLGYKLLKHFESPITRMHRE